LRTVLIPLSLTNATTSAPLFLPFLKWTRLGRRLASHRDYADATILVDLDFADVQTRRQRAFDNSGNV